MKRYKHNLSNYRLATGSMGFLYPVQIAEVLPGDTMQLQTSILLRLAPMLAPVMHPVKVRIHQWYVPNRIIWDGWEDFITGGPDGMNSDTIPTTVLASTTGIGPGVYDYFGVPCNQNAEGMSVNALPVMAYNKIFNEFYRDQDLTGEVAPLTQLCSRVSWNKDAFTTSRPWAQKGPDVLLPLAQRAPVKGLAKVTQDYADVSASVFETGESASTTFATSSLVGGTTGEDTMKVAIEEDPDNPGFPGVYADLSQATGATVNEVRRLFAMQRYQEARARYGSRHSEYLRFLGIKPSDARLQRPEYLGGGSQTISFSEVLQTGEDTASADGAVGAMRGHGIAALRTRKARKFFEEHGYVMTLVSVVPKNIYQDGIPRHFLKQDKEDYFQKELQHIGQQEVFNNEVYADPVDGMNTFGYQDRYSEYTSILSGVSGEFRDLLDFWHLGRKFDSPPALNDSFIKCDPSRRIFAEQTQDPLWMMVNNKTVARRMVKTRTGIGRII